MKLVMTLVVRDEADILDANLAFHLNAGVDFVIATDHDSHDGTTEILRSYERAGVLHFVRESTREVRQAEWVTRMARAAATDFGADWVLNADGDEFWWPRSGSLNELLDAVPEHFGIVSGFMRNFVPRPNGHPFFAERMTFRLPLRAALSGTDSPLIVERKVAHRADPTVRVRFGNHDVAGDRLRLLRTWLPIEVLHFPLRGPDQCARKFSKYGRWEETDLDPLGRHQEIGYRWTQAGKAAEYYESFVLDEVALQAALLKGAVVVDTRLRDVLRELRLPADERVAGRQFRIPAAEKALVRLPECSVDEVFLEDVDVMGARDWVEKRRTRVEALEERVADLERSPIERLWGRRVARRRLSADLSA